MDGYMWTRQKLGFNTLLFCLAFIPSPGTRRSRSGGEWGVEAGTLHQLLPEMVASTDLMDGPVLSIYSIWQSMCPIGREYPSLCHTQCC